MRTLQLALLAVILAAGISVLALAAVADPLSGTWTGDWGPSAMDRNQVTVEFCDIFLIAVAETFRQRGNKQHQRGNQRDHQTEQDKPSSISPQFFERQIDRHAMSPLCR